MAIQIHVFNVHVKCNFGNLRHKVRLILSSISEVLLSAKVANGTKGKLLT